MVYTFIAIYHFEKFGLKPHSKDHKFDIFVNSAVAINQSYYNLSYGYFLNFFLFLLCNKCIP